MSDFNHGGGVIGWSNIDETRAVTVELTRRGYSEAEIAKLWTGKVLRIWQIVIDKGERGYRPTASPK